MSSYNNRKVAEFDEIECDVMEKKPWTETKAEILKMSYQHHTVYMNLDF